MRECVPFFDLPALHTPLRDTLVAQYQEIIESAGFIGGRTVDEFEADFARYCEASGCVGVSSGTDALTLALRALGVEAGDAVLVPAFSFVATAEAVMLRGAEPRFCDIDPKTYTMSAESAAGVDPAGIKAVVPVHLYGHPAEMHALRALAVRRGWAVLEDAAQAHGARELGRRVGSLGDLAAFSFYPSKNLGALGDAGAVVGSRSDWLGHVRRLGDHGRVSRHVHVEWGTTARMDALQAAALHLKLRHLDRWNTARIEAARAYDQRLRELDGVVTPSVREGCEHVYHLYVIRVPERDALLERFARAQVEAAVHYPTPLHLQPAFRHLGHGRGDFPVSEALADECVSLPLFPGITESQIDRVASVVAEHVSRLG